MLIVSGSVVVISVLVAAEGCMEEALIWRNRIPCKQSRNLKKHQEALQLLSQCGMVNEVMWAKTEDGRTFFCIDELPDGFEPGGKTVMPGDASKAGKMTIVVTQCTMSAGDVAMQIAGEYYRQHPSRIGSIDDESSRLNELAKCILRNHGTLTRKWRHPEENLENGKCTCLAMWHFCRAKPEIGPCQVSVGSQFR